MLGGLYDINSEFYRLQSAGLFLNSSFGIGPEFSQSGIDGPSIFPRTALGVRVAYKPSGNVVLRAAAMDGVPLIRGNNRLAAFERAMAGSTWPSWRWLDRPGARPRRPAQPHRSQRHAADVPGQIRRRRLALHHHLRRARSHGGEATQRGASGFYAIGDGVVARDAGDPGRSLSVFVQLGVGDAGVDRFGRYLGAGLVAIGPFRQRS